MNVKRGKRGQMKMSFGMIFSIILIIVFLVVAFFAIQKFLSFQKEIVYKQFVEDLQTDIDKMWKSPQGSTIETYLVPSTVNSICFSNNEFYNLKINHKNKYYEEELNYLDLENILQGQAETCIQAVDSKIKVIIQKNYSEPLVTVKPAE